MQDRALRSQLKRRFSQDEFATWVDERTELGDSGHYELLRARVIVTPPAGYPHGAIEVNATHLLASFVKPRGLGTVFGSSQGFDVAPAARSSRTRASSRRSDGRLHRARFRENS